MTDVVVDISMSLDGFVAGPDDGLGRGLGEGGEPSYVFVTDGIESALARARAAAGDKDVRHSPYATHIRYRVENTSR